MEERIEKVQRKVIVSNIVMLALVIIAILGVVLYYEMKTKMLVGGMYSRDTNAANVMLKEMFSNDFTYDNLELAEQAVKEGGYTQDAFRYLFLLSEKKYVILAGIAVVVVAMIITIWKNGISVYREISDIRGKLIKENADLKKDLQEENEYIKRRNVQLQNFTENIAHQIKTPLTALGLKLEVLSEMMENSNQQVEDCFFQISRIKEFVKRLLLVSRMESGKVTFKKEKVVVEELIEEIVSATASEEKITCTYTLPEGYTIQGDNEWLREGILNIIVNGLEAEKGKGDKHIYVEVSEEDEKCIINVSDNGKGLSDKNINKIFDRFESNVSAESFNMGIGLNLSMLIVKAHYGNIFVENSKEYGGASFRIVLPQYKFKESYKL